MLHSASIPCPRRGSVRSRTPAAVALGLLALWAGGCGPDATATNTVTGKVTVNGKPAATGAMVKFIRMDNKLATGGVGVDGSYFVSDAPEGPVKISVVGVPSPLVKSVMPGASAATGEPIPPRYADFNNGLTYTVKKGKQTFDILLMP